MGRVSPGAAINNVSGGGGGSSSTITNLVGITSSGQALAASSLPVVLTAAQITSLTPLSSVSISAGSAVIGHVITDSGSTTILGSNTNVDIGKLTANQSVNVTQFAGANLVSATAGVPRIGTADASGIGLLSAANALDSTGSGIQATQIVGQFDDTSPGTVTENRFGNIRMSVRREMYGQIRDAAGNERGVNVTAGNALTVDGSATTQPVSYATTGSGTATGALRVELANNGTGQISTVTTVSTLTNQTQQGGVNISLNAGAVDTGTRRVIQANGAGKTIVSAGGSAASSGNNTIVSAGTNKLKVFAFTLSTVSTTAVTCIFQSGASGTELWRVILQTPASVAGGANLAVSPPAWLFATGAATLLNLNLSAAVAVNWSVSYYDEA